MHQEGSENEIEEQSSNSCKHGFYSDRIIKPLSPCDTMEPYWICLRVKTAFYSELM